jgi:predicted methyltransferase MtxX (methanogen marker protein 4)
MSLRKFILVVLGLVFLGCAAKTSQSAKRTLAGISQQQVLVSAQHTLAKKGLDVEKISLDNG